MKKALLIVVLLATANNIMAQNNLLLSQPNLKTPFKFKLDTGIKLPTLKDFTNLPQTNVLKNLYDLKSIGQPALANFPLTHRNGYNMPIAVLSGHDNMPIKKIDGFYTMPVSGQELNKKSSVTLIHP